MSKLNVFWGVIMNLTPRLKHPLVLPLRLSDFDRERLLLHAHILRERAKAHPAEANTLLQIARSFDRMLEEYRVQQSQDAEVVFS